MSVTNQLSCDLVKGVFSDAGCCADSQNNEINKCEDIEFTKPVEVPANLNYDSISVRYDVKAQIRNNEAMKVKFENSHELASNSERFTGCSGVCWNDPVFFNKPAVKAIIAANFTGLNLPEYDASLKDLINYPYIYNRVENYTDTHGAKPISCAEEAILLSSEFKTVFSGMEGYVDFEGTEAGATWPSTGPYERCFNGHSRDTFTGFDAIMDAEYFEDHVFVSGGARTLDRFEAASISYNAKPVTTFYARSDPEYPDGHPLKYELMWPMNGGVRPSLAAHGDHVCMSGMVGPLYGFNNYGPNTGWEKRSEFMQKVKYLQKKSKVNHVGVACWKTDYKAGDEPVKTYHLYDDDFRPIYNQLMTAAVPKAEADLNIIDTCSGSNLCWETLSTINANVTQNLTKMTDEQTAEFTRLRNRRAELSSIISRKEKALSGPGQLFVNQWNIRDTDMDAENIYINVHEGSGNSVLSAVIRIDRQSGQIYMSDFAQFTISEKTSVKSGARAFHMSVDDQFIHILQNENNNQKKLLIKYPKNFVNGEKPIGVRRIGQDTGFFSNQRWLNAAGFFGTNPIASFGNKIYFPAHGMFSATNDYTFANYSDNLNVKQIPFPASRPWRIGAELFLNSNEYTSDNKVSSIVYGCHASDTHVFFMYGMSRNFDIMRNDQTRFDGEITADLKFTHAHQKEWIIFKVDPVTDTVVDTIEVVTEQASGSESFVVDPKGEYAYIGSGDNNRENVPEPGFVVDISPWGLVRKVRLTSGTKKVQGDNHITPGAVSTTLHLEGDTTRTVTLDYDGLHMKSSGNNVENIRIKGSEVGIVHMDNDKRNVYLGSNVGNMGIPQIMAKSDAKQEDNIIIGTKSGNIMHGMSRNIIIGNNIGNVGFKPYFEKDRSLLDVAKYGKIKNKVTTGDDFQVSTEGQFALGMHSKLLLSGNLDHQVLNIPAIDTLKNLNKKLNADQLIDPNNAVFVKNNIVQVINKNNKIDGVQYLIDKMLAQSERICRLENPTSPELCVVQQRTSMVLEVYTGKRNGQERFSLQRKQGSNWESIISWDGLNIDIADPFDVSYSESPSVRFLPPVTLAPPNEGVSYADEFGSSIDGFKFTGKIIPGTYKLVIEDTEKNGWGNDDGIGPGPVMRNHHGAYFEGGNANANLMIGTTYKRASLSGYNQFGDDPLIVEAMEIVGHKLTKAQQTYQEVVFNVEGVYCADEIVLEYRDTYGDGWNGASLKHLYDGTVYTVAVIDGQNKLSQKICASTLTDGCTVFEFTSGAWDSEVMIKIISEEFGTLDTTGSDIQGSRISMCPDGIKIA